MEQQSHQHQSQTGLMRSRLFAPFFWTQFLGAFNDNLFKNALLTLITFNALYATSISTDVMNNIGAVLFILPFFLFSAFAGQLADKYEKSFLIRRIKLFEIVAMCFAAICFYFNTAWGLMLVLFLMGTQSAFFGPVKYSIIPQHLRSDELVSGNALVETGTFLAILLGTIGSGLLSKVDDAPMWFSIIVVVMAIIGWLTSRAIPVAPAPSPEINVTFRPWKDTWETIAFSRENKAIYLAIIAISWFWFLGASYLTQLYNYSKVFLHGDQSVVTSLLAVFSIGIAAGSLLCDKLSGHKIELGLVPLGSIGLSIFGFDLYLHSQPVSGTELISFKEFLTEPWSYRVLLDFFLIGTFGGFYIVPLYAMVQERSEEKHRSRIIAAINIMNALFMVVSGIVGVIFLSVIGVGIPEFFMVLALMNAVVAIYIYRTIPEFFMRFLIWVITHTMYRVRHEGLDKIPDTGACVLVCNHVSYMDALIIGGAYRRPIRFVMFKPIYHLPVLHYIFKIGKAIPIHSQKIDPVTYENAFKMISHELRDGEIVCLFPEGKLTTTGEIDTFRKGIEQIIATDPVPVIPMALKGLWGSFFSHKDGSALTKAPRRFWSKVDLVVGDPIDAKDVSAQKLEDAVKALRGANA